MNNPYYNANFRPVARNWIIMLLLKYLQGVDITAHEPDALRHMAENNDDNNQMMDLIDRAAISIAAADPDQLPVDNAEYTALEEHMLEVCIKWDEPLFRAIAQYLDAYVNLRGRTSMKYERRLVPLLHYRRGIGEAEAKVIAMASTVSDLPGSNNVLAYHLLWAAAFLVMTSRIITEKGCDLKRDGYPLEKLSRAIDHLTMAFGLIHDRSDAFKVLYHNLETWGHKLAASTLMGTTVNLRGRRAIYINLPKQPGDKGQCLIAEARGRQFGYDLKQNGFAYNQDSDLLAQIELLDEAFEGDEE